MAYRLVSPCTIVDLAEVVVWATAEQMAMFRIQIAAGNSFALRDGRGEAVACGGFAPVEGVAHAWFVVSEGRGPRAIVPILRAIVLTLERQPYDPICIEVETIMGARIARLIGARPDDGVMEDRNGKGNIVFIWRRRQGVEAGGGNGPGRGGGEPAPRAGADGKGQCRR